MTAFKRKKALLCVLVLVCFVFSACAHHVSFSYEDWIEQGYAFLNEQDYESARSAFEKARKMDEKNPLAYVGLYQSEPDEEAREEWLVQGLEKTSLQNQKQFQVYAKLQAQALDESVLKSALEQMALEGYSVLKENLPDFEMSPIPYNNQAYLIKSDGVYGLMDAEGTICYEFDASIYRMEHRTLSGTENICVQQPSKTKYVTSFDTILNGTDINTACGGLGGTRSMSYLYDPLQKNFRAVILYGDAVQMQAYIPDTLYTSCIIGGLSLLQAQSLEELDNINEINAQLKKYSEDVQVYYLYNQAEDRFYGPYETSELAAYGAWQISDLYHASDSYFFMSNLYSDFQSLEGLFYEETEEGYVLHSTSLPDKTSAAYKSARPISEHAMIVEHEDGKLGVINESLEEVFSGYFEDISLPVENHVPVKVNGAWKLIETK